MDEYGAGSRHGLNKYGGGDEGKAKPVVSEWSGGDAPVNSDRKQVFINRIHQFATLIDFHAPSEVITATC